jgi:hypothetical protein
MGILKKLKAALQKLKPPPLPPLHEAARRGDIERIKELLQKGADPKAKFEGQKAWSFADQAIGVPYDKRDEAKVLLWEAEQAATEYSDEELSNLISKCPCGFSSFACPACKTKTSVCFRDVDIIRGLLKPEEVYVDGAAVSEPVSYCYSCNSYIRVVYTHRNPYHIKFERLDIKLSGEENFPYGCPSCGKMKGTVRAISIPGFGAKRNFFGYKCPDCGVFWKITRESENPKRFTWKRTGSDPSVSISKCSECSSEVSCYLTGFLDGTGCSLCRACGHRWSNY